MKTSQVKKTIGNFLAVGMATLCMMAGFGMSFKTEAYAYTSTYYAENDRGECEFDLLGERVKNWNLDDYAEAYVNGPYFDRLQAYELSGDQAHDVIYIADSQTGYHEGSSEHDLSGESNGSDNYTEFGRYYGSTGGAWCAKFVSWCFAAAGMTGDQYHPAAAASPFDGNGGKSFAFLNTSTGEPQYGCQVFTWKDFAEGSYQPISGDLVFWGNQSTAGMTVYEYATTRSMSHYHVGFISNELSTTGKIWTIEGNSGPNTDQVIQYQPVCPDPDSGRLRSGKYIVSFVRPAYRNTSHVLSYDLQGGIGDFPQIRKGHNYYFHISDLAPTRTGAEFMGWSLNSPVEASEDPDLSRVEYWPGDRIVLRGDAKLCAVWKTTSSQSPYDTAWTAVSAAPMFPLPEVFADSQPVETAASDLGPELDAFPAQEPGSWEEQAFSYVFFDANGGTDEPPCDIVAEGAVWQLPEQQPRRDSHFFLGWSLLGDDSGRLYLPGEAVVIEGPTVFTAQWEYVQFCILSYDDNGGFGGPVWPEISVATVGSELYISNTVPVREGFRFLGWADSPDAADAQYLPGECVLIYSDWMVYAVWGPEF